MTDLALLPMTEDQARTLTADIQGRVSDLLPLIREAFDRRADVALGYDSWFAYCTKELSDIRIPVGERPALIAELRQAGMSTRAIGAATGIPKSTVADTLAQLSEAGQLTEPERVSSLDGRNRPASQPARPAPVRDEVLAPDPVVMPVRQQDADTITTAIDEHVAAKAAVADAMDRFLPPDTDAPRREWNLAFLSALRPTFKLMAQFTPEAVAETADDECLDELAGLAKQLQSYLDRVRAARPVPDNVRHLRVAS